MADGLIDSRLDDAALARALAKILPPDVRPRELRTVPEEFNAMHDAVRKTYRYRLDRSPHGDPLIARFALHYPYELDVERVRAGLARLAGRHDWSGFADSRCRIENRVRTLVRATYRERGRRGWFTFCADGFLTYMVRNLVGTLLEIGAARRSVDTLDRILETGDRRLAAATAAARGLCLWRIEYATEHAPGDRS